MQLYNVHNKCCSLYIEISVIENLTAVDNCRSVEVNWNAIEGPCKGLLYNVTLLHIGSDEMTSVTSNTTHSFTGTSLLSGDCNVIIFAFNENVNGRHNETTAIPGVVSFICDSTYVYIATYIRMYCVCTCEYTYVYVRMFEYMYNAPS